WYPFFRSKPMFLCSIEHVASENLFYDCEEIDEEFGREQFIEKALSVLEGEAAKVLNDLLTKLNTNNFIRLHPDQRQFLALFLSVQMLRTRENRLIIQQMSNKLAEWVHSHLTEEMKAAAPDQVPPLRISEKEL